MSLPFEIARCIGTPARMCCLCRRREPGGQLQMYIAPAWSVVHGTCQNFIGAAICTNSTAPKTALNEWIFPDDVPVL
jgi:hypothetical protein